VYIKKRPTKETCTSKRDLQKRPTAFFSGEVKGDGGAAVQRSVSNTSYAYHKKTLKRDLKKDLK